MRLHYLSIMAVLFLGACTSQNKPIGLMGAMEEEIELVKSNMTDIQEIKIGNMTFYKGKIGKKDIVLSLSGIGKVNAAVTTTLLINKFNAKAIMFTGVGGAITNTLKVGDVVIGTNFIHYDVDLTAFGLELGRLSRETVWKYPADDKLVVLAIKTAQSILPNQKIIKGRVISGDVFVTDYKQKIYLANTFQAEALDMESSVVAHVAYKFGVPVVILRSMSDSMKGDEQEYQDLFKEIAKNSANILLNMINSPEFPY